MNRRLSALLLCAALGSAATGWAQSLAPNAPSGPGAGPGAGEHKHGWGRHDPARMQEMVAKRLAALKQKLAITPAQEGAWSAWASAMMPPATRPARPSRDEVARMTTPERLDLANQAMRQRTTRMEQRSAATKTFYAALNAEQKKTFDEISLRHFARMHGGGHGGHGGPGMHGGPRGG